MKECGRLRIQSDGGEWREFFYAFKRWSHRLRYWPLCKHSRLPSFCLPFLSLPSTFSLAYFPVHPLTHSSSMTGTLPSCNPPSATAKTAIGPPITKTIPSTAQSRHQHSILTINAGYANSTRRRRRRWRVTCRLWRGAIRYKRDRAQPRRVSCVLIRGGYLKRQREGCEGGAAETYG